MNELIGWALENPYNALTAFGLIVKIVWDIIYQNKGQKNSTLSQLIDNQESLQTQVTNLQKQNEEKDKQISDLKDDISKFQDSEFEISLLVKAGKTYGVHDIKMKRVSRKK